MPSVPALALGKHPVKGLSRESSQKKKTVPRDVPAERYGGTELSGCRIDERHAGGLEVAAVQGRDSEAMGKGGRGYQAVLNGHWLTAPTKVGEKLGPAQTDSRIPGEAVHPPHSLIEPALQPRASSAPRQQENPEPDLTQDNRVDDELPLVAAQPFDHPLIGLRLGRLGKDVGIDEVLHSESVDSESMATK